MQSKSLYQFTLQDTDLKNLYSWIPRVESRMSQIPGLQDVTSDLRIASPQITVDIDRDKARSMGVQHRISRTRL
jgi:HAE1 family hydrophobic/amphiphilic exporter-1